MAGLDTIQNPRQQQRRILSNYSIDDTTETKRTNVTE